MTISELIAVLRDLEGRGLGDLEVRSDGSAGSLAAVEVATPGYDEMGAPCVVLNDTLTHPEPAYCRKSRKQAAH